MAPLDPKAAIRPEKDLIVAPGRLRKGKPETSWEFQRPDKVATIFASLCFSMPSTFAASPVIS
jgi:hypothetical protein